MLEFSNRYAEVEIIINQDGLYEEISKADLYIGASGGTLFILSPFFPGAFSTEALFEALLEALFEVEVFPEDPFELEVDDFTTLDKA